MNLLSSLLSPRLILVVATLFANIFQASPTSLAEHRITRSNEIPAISSSLPTLAAFVRQVTNGNAQQITGIYAAGVFALAVVQQPAGTPTYISTRPDVLTEFSLASNYGSQGFLAHNNLAGKLFSQLGVGNTLVVVHGNGSQQTYQIDQVRHFKAVSPNSPYSNYVDLENKAQITNGELFNQTYGKKGLLILQTCIAANGIDSWGRLFILASPVATTAAPHAGN